MATFFAELRVYRHPDHHFDTIALEIPAATIEEAVGSLNCYFAGLRANSNFDHAVTESVGKAKRRGETYLTMAEAAKRLSSFF